MMSRITIEWDEVSPFLQKISGILTIEDVDNGYQYFKEVLKCRVDYTPGTFGYHALPNNEGMKSTVMNKHDKHIRDMVHSYFQGMLLNTSIYSWRDDEGITKTL